MWFISCPILLLIMQALNLCIVCGLLLGSLLPSSPTSNEPAQISPESQRRYSKWQKRQRLLKRSQAKRRLFARQKQLLRRRATRLRHKGDHQNAMDPLVLVTLRNATESLLLRLSDDMLVDIMKHLTFFDLLSLRRSSRRFMYLFSLQKFKQFHGPYSVGNVWTTPLRYIDLDYTRLRGFKTYHKDILKERFCTPCLQARLERMRQVQRGRNHNPPEARWFHCSGCGSDHHARLFSEEQLAAPPTQRICIGWEGRLSLCQHVSISYDEIQRRMESGNKALERVATCKHPDHLFETHCDVSTPSDEEPDADFTYQNGQEYLRLFKLNHISLPVDKDGSRPTAEDIRQRLEEIQQLSPMPWYPLDHPTLTPMRAIDPNTCGCYHYEGSNRVRWVLKDREKKKRRRQRSIWSSNQAAGAKACDSIAHEKTESFPKSPSSISMCIRACRSSQTGWACQKIIQWRCIALGQPWEAQWRLAIDPNSHGELPFKNLTWCDSKGCSNYAGFRLKEPSILKLGRKRWGTGEPNRACIGDCDWDIFWEE